MLEKKTIDKLKTKATKIRISTIRKIDGTAADKLVITVEVDVIGLADDGEQALGLAHDLWSYAISRKGANLVAGSCHGLGLLAPL